MRKRFTKKRGYGLIVAMLMGWVGLLHAQSTITVTGKIVLQDGTPASGVSIMGQGGVVATAADTDRNYRSRASPNGILVFTQLGATTQEIAIGNRSVIDITLEEDVSALDEVVVVGYGTQKKVNLSGSVAQIDGEALTSRPVANVTGALQGVAPGVTVVRGSGQPGDEGYGIRIRGFSSANSADALVLVDGIQMDMNLLNPDDVASISVLKDASASAIYGARAAGGVILVTTKKGAAGKTPINFNSYSGINVTARQPERLNSCDEQLLIDESRFNATGNREYSEEQMEWVSNPNFSVRPNPTQDRWEYFGNNNWLKEGMDKVNSMQNHTLSVGGSTEKMNYLVSDVYYQRHRVLRHDTA